MIRKFLVALAVMASMTVTACGPFSRSTGGPDVTQPAVTVEQRAYEAHRQYNLVLDQAVKYAKSPIADPDVVIKLNEVNKRVEPAARYVNAYFSCSPPSLDFIICAGEPFNEQTLVQKLQLLTTTTRELLKLVPATPKE